MQPRLYFLLLHLNREKLSNIQWNFFLFRAPFDIRSSLLFVISFFYAVSCDDESTMWIRHGDDGVILRLFAHVPLKLPVESVYKSFEKLFNVYRCSRYSIQTLDSLWCVIHNTYRTETWRFFRCAKRKRHGFNICFVIWDDNITSHLMISTHTHSLEHLERKHCSFYLSMCVDGRVCSTLADAVTCPWNRLPANTHKRQYMHMVSHPFSPLTHKIFYGKLFPLFAFFHRKNPQLFGCTFQFD